MCSPGKYADVTGLEDCVDCGVGKFNPSNSSAAESQCIQCPAGRFNPSIGSAQIEECKSCISGHVNTLMGQASSDACILCAAGKFANAHHFECVACPAGTFRNTDVDASEASAACSSCPPGQYTDSPGQTECTECPHGHNDEHGSIACGTWTDSLILTAMPYPVQIQSGNFLVPPLKIEIENSAVISGPNLICSLDQVPLHDAVASGVFLSGNMNFLVPLEYSTGPFFSTSVSIICRSFSEVDRELHRLEQRSNYRSGVKQSALLKLLCAIHKL